MTNDKEETPESDPTEEMLSDAAAKLDAQGGEGEVEVESPSAKPPEPRAPGTDEQTPDGQVAEPGKTESSATNADKPTKTEQTPKGERQRDTKTGRFAPKGEEPTPEPSKPETPYAKAAKDEERYDRNWQKLNADQEKFRQEKAEFERQRDELQSGMEGRHPQRATKEGFTADEYYAAAADFEKDGDKAMAFEAFKAGQEIEAFEYQHAQEQQARVVDETYNRGMKETMDANPELCDPSSDWAKQTMEILGQYGWLYFVENGFKIAADVAKLRLDAALVPELRKQLKTMEENLSTTNSKLQPVRGRASAPAPGAKAFKDMSPEEQEKYLETRAEELDAQGVL